MRFILEFRDARSHFHKGVFTQLVIVKDIVYYAVFPLFGIYLIEYLYDKIVITV